MAGSRFKDPMLERCYRAGRKAGADPASGLYCSPLGDEGPRCPFTGGAIYEAYWKGRAGVENVTVPGSTAHAFWAAGQDDAKALGAISPRWLGLGILGSHLATKNQLRAFLAEPEARLPWAAP